MTDVSTNYQNTGVTYVWLKSSTEIDWLDAIGLNFAVLDIKLFKYSLLVKEGYCFKKDNGRCSLKCLIRHVGSGKTEKCGVTLLLALDSSWLAFCTIFGLYLNTWIEMERH